MSLAWFLAGLVVGGTGGAVSMVLLVAHGQREKRGECIRVEAER